MHTRKEGQRGRELEGETGGGVGARRVRDRERKREMCGMSQKQKQTFDVKILHDITSEKKLF